MNGTLLFLLIGILFTGGAVSYVPVFGELSYENMVETVPTDLDNFRGNEHLTRPTFGVSHEQDAVIEQRPGHYSQVVPGLPSLGDRSETGGH